MNKTSSSLKVVMCVFSSPVHCSKKAIGINVCRCASPSSTRICFKWQLLYLWANFNLTLLDCFQDEAIKIDLLWQNHGCHRGPSFWLIKFVTLPECKIIWTEMTSWWPTKNSLINIFNLSKNSLPEPKLKILKKKLPPNFYEGLHVGSGIHYSLKN